MRLIIILFFAIPSLLIGQAPASQYVDVVHLHGKDAVTGTVITYEYGHQVVLVKDDGTTMNFDWSEVKRVNFRLDKEREEEVVQAQQATLKPVPEQQENSPRSYKKRKFVHQLSAGMSFGAVQFINTDFGFNFRRVNIGGGAAYHLIRRFNRINLGVGLDLSLMNHQLQEKVLSATGQAEYLFGRGKNRTFIRLEGGMSYPFGAGNRDGEVTQRTISPLVHPSIGLEFGGEKGPLQRLVVDLGYRFLTNRFTITDANLDVIERKVQYQRLILRAGVRF